MKYVRTKDNIYEIVNDYGSSCAVKSKGKRGRTAIDGFIVKYGLSYAPRADTIEELCDRYVVINQCNKTKWVYTKKQFKKRVERNKTHIGGRDTYADRLMYLLEYNDVYLAIWTDKGLIYVAKMNDKGELELL